MIPPVPVRPWPQAGACTDGGEGNKKKFNALSVDGRVLCYALQPDEG
jgi:hypothetical protein